MSNSTSSVDDQISSNNSAFAVIAPTISGTISTASSALIIFIIFQSRSKLSTIYHRIMFGMSCADILSSVAMALSTLPMPREDLSQELMDRGYEYEYPPYGGTKLGTVQTCTAQGFFFTFGVYAMFSYNLSLCFYNTCAIALCMRETTIVRYVEPVLHLLPLAKGLGMGLSLAIGNYFRPTIFANWCWVRNTPRFYELNNQIGNVVFLTLIILCGVMMVRRVYYIERRLINAQRSGYYERAANSLKNTKVVIFQMSLYILSYIVTLLPLVILHLMPDEMDTTVLFYLQQILFPLQGFFNALIFINHKIYNYRRCHSGVSRCHVLKLLLSGDSEEVMLFSRISMINYDQRRRIMELEFEDESGYVERISVEDKPPSSADVFVGDMDGNQHLSGFSELRASAPQCVDTSSIDSRGSKGLSESSSKLPLNENEHSANDESSIGPMNDSRLSYSRTSGSIFSWMSRANNADVSRGGLSGISSVGEEDV